MREKLTYQSQRYNINLIEQEESYTSKADFLANDSIPVYSTLDKRKYLFSGKRISRGQYKSSKDLILNADINGSFNIMRKANIKKINLNNRDYLNPLRIRIA